MPFFNNYGKLQLAPSEDFNTATLTTNTGAPVDDVEHSMTVGPKGGYVAVLCGSTFAPELAAMICKLAFTHCNPSSAAETNMHIFLYRLAVPKDGNLTRCVMLHTCTAYVRNWFAGPVVLEDVTLVEKLGQVCKHCCCCDP